MAMSQEHLRSPGLWGLWRSEFEAADSPSIARYRKYDMSQSTLPLTGVASALQVLTVLTVLTVLAAKKREELHLEQERKLRHFRLPQLILKV